MGNRDPYQDNSSLLYIKVSEINKASKEGELYSTLASGVSGSPEVKTEPAATADEEYFQASKMNTVSSDGTFLNLKWWGIFFNLKKRMKLFQ